MEYTITDLREMVAYIDAQIMDQEREAIERHCAPVFDDRLLWKREHVMQAIRNLERSAQFDIDMGRGR